jgi:hypothetical protein
MADTRMDSVELARRLLDAKTPADRAAALAAIYLTTEETDK